MNPYTRHVTTTNTIYRNAPQKVVYTQSPAPQRVYNAPPPTTTTYRPPSPMISTNSRRVRSVNTTARPNNLTNQARYVPVHPPKSPNTAGLDHISKNLQMYRNSRNTTNEKRMGGGQPRPASIRRTGYGNNGNVGHQNVGGVYGQNHGTNQVIRNRGPSVHSRNSSKPRQQRSQIQQTIQLNPSDPFQTTSTEIRFGEKPKSNAPQFTAPIVNSERQNNTTLYTSNIQKSQLLNTGQAGQFGGQSKAFEKDVAYQSINPIQTNYNPNSSQNQYVVESNVQNNYQSHSRKSYKSGVSRNDSTGRIKGNTFIPIPKVVTNYGIMNPAKKKHGGNKRNKSYYDNNDKYNYTPKMEESGGYVNGYNTAEKNKKEDELLEYQRTVTNIDSNKLFKNNYQLNKQNQLALDENIFDRKSNFMEEVRNRSRSQNASRSRSRLEKRDLIGKSTEKGPNLKARAQKLDPFSYEYNFSPNVSEKKIEKKNTLAPQQKVGQMPKSRYDDSSITFDPIIERKVRALPKDKVEKALFNSNNIKSVEDLKDKIMKKNEILMKLKAQHMKLMQDPKNPENLRSQLEMREKQNKKILEKIKKIKDQTEQKKEEYKELIEIDNQMKSLLSMMTESEKKERDRLIAELKRTDELYMKTKRENEMLKAEMEDPSKGMVFKQNLIDEEVNRVKSMIDDQLEDDYEKGNQMLIDQIQKMYHKLMAAKN